MIVISQAEVREHLTFARCIPLMREAMIALSRGETRQLLRSILDLELGRAFGVMPGAMATEGVFGAKLISVFPENFAKGIQSHQGLVVIFDGESGAPTAALHAGEITRIRTAAASAAATDALALPDAANLAILGYGAQAHAHAAAIAHVRKLARVTIWGREDAKAAALARTLEDELGVPCSTAPDVRTAVHEADIICTTTASPEPILESAWVKPGAHVNAVGSSRAGPSEIAGDLVVRARFIADYREGVLAQGAEFLRAKAAGLVTDAHVIGEIGEVFDGRRKARTAAGDVTLYKSLGHIVQDLASAAALLRDADTQGFGQRVALNG
jgi:ornithine cyclodeaminase/alanine dehydrogenase-like protein (mu-crystallin family)